MRLTVSLPRPPPPQSAVGRSKNSKLYLQFIKIEMCTSGIFAALHMVAVIASLGTYILDAVTSIVASITWVPHNSLRRLWGICEGSKIGFDSVQRAVNPPG